MTTPPPPPPPRPEPVPQPAAVPPDTEPLVSLRTALVLLTAAFIGTVLGALTALSTGNPAAGLIAALTGFGVATLGLHKLIGR
ncbi:hypothetical protein ACQKM2_03235 [Streptomyces sp. NPDC004126]|uniref:hypothetical protein n=1 Tax=Streptomyces sp. NPDC004126 TaxID=3390695 RepID=UPI003D046275